MSNKGLYGLPQGQRSQTTNAGSASDPLLAYFTPTSSPFAITESTFGTNRVYASQGTDILRYDPVSLTLLATFARTPSRGVNAASYAPTSDQLVFGYSTFMEFVTASTGTINSTSNTGASNIPQNIIYVPSVDRIYVTYSNPVNQVGVWNAGTYSSVWNFNFANSRAGVDLVYVSSVNRIYVTCDGAVGEIKVIDPSTNTVTATITTNLPSYVYHMVYIPTIDRLLVTSLGSPNRTFALINPSTNTVTETFVVPFIYGNGVYIRPTFCPTTGLVYIYSDSYELMCLDLAKREFVGRYKQPGTNSFGLFYHSLTNTLWLSQGNIAVIKPLKGVRYVT